VESVTDEVLSSPWSVGRELDCEENFESYPPLATFLT